MIRARQRSNPVHRAGYARSVLGEEEALVLEVKPFVMHGLTLYDVAIAFRDRSVAQARLGPESIPDNLEPGEQVLATRVASMVVSLRRPASQNEGSGADLRP